MIPLTIIATIRRSQGNRSLTLSTAKTSIPTVVGGGGEGGGGGGGGGHGEHCVATSGHCVTKATTAHCVTVKVSAHVVIWLEHAVGVGGQSVI